MTTSQGIEHLNHRLAAAKPSATYQNDEDVAIALLLVAQVI